LRLDTKCIRYI